MGLSFSRSVKFGALRFNFSGSGIGVSAGVPGFRIGTGPRGAYISGSVAGFRYRQSLGVKKRQQSDSRRPLSPDLQPGSDSSTANNIASTKEHVTADVMMLTDASGDELLRSMNEQAGKKRLWPAVAVLLIIALVFLSDTLKTVHESANAVVLILGIAVTLWIRHLDKLRKLTVLFYEVDAATGNHYEQLTDGSAASSRVKKIRSILATSRYKNSKYEAGASRGLKFGKASISVGQAPGVVANINVPLVNSENLCLAFFPDRVLAFQNGKIGAVEYANLELDLATSTFIETEGVPSDATVVDHTWQYVNKKGGPDKRFKNNRQYPVCRYQQLTLSTSTGLNVQIIGSKSDSFNQLSAALRNIEAKHASPIRTF